MIIATWNVNSIKARLTNALNWLKEFSPDVVLMQEIKTINETFPYSPIEDLGYNIKVHGQKTFNGVAIISKYSIEDVQTNLPNFKEDDKARYIEALIDGHIRVASVYAPNGNPINTEKFTYKIKWMDKFIEHTKTLLSYNEPLILGGDYNVVMTEKDIYDYAAFKDDAITQPETQERYKKLLDLGLTDAFNHLNHNQETYTYWDYRANAFKCNLGICLDHILLNKETIKLLKSCNIDKTPRSKEQPSDHTPLWIEIT